MQLFFGMAADGRTFPGRPGADNGAVHWAEVGPAGFVGVLEVQVGLVGPQVTNAVRIAGCVAKLRAARDERVWPAAFAKVPRSTAVQLLERRELERQ